MNDKIFCLEDSFYSEENVRHLEKSISQLNEGKIIIKSFQEIEKEEVIKNVADDLYEDTLKIVCQEKAQVSFNSMRAKAAANGYMSDDEIEGEIAAARREQNQRSDREKSID